MFDISTLVTDRTQADVQAWNDKGTYNPSDLNRVTHAMEYLVERIRSYGYAVKYEKVKVPHQQQKGKSRLPAGYTELEYIESTGTQYIDTGFVPNQDTRVVMEAEHSVTSAVSWIFGVRTASGKNMYAFLAYQNKYRTDYNTTITSYGTAITAMTKVDKDKNITTLNGTEVITNAYASFDCQYPLFLLAMNTAGTASGFASAKVKIMKIYDNGAIVRNYVPCVDPSGAIGLYDMVNGIFYGNAGTGAFIAGAEVCNDKFYLTNMLSDGSFENVASNWNCWLAEPTDTSQAKDGTQSLKLGGDALAATQSTIPIVTGHTYYGREYIKTDGELTASDCRFEVIGGTDNGEHSFVFGWNRGNYPDWTAISSVITVDQTPASSYGLRTFTVGGSVSAWVDSIVLIDLTEAFGEGNEPDKEWCDKHIPYFDSTYAVSAMELLHDYTWYHSDIPQERELTAYLQNVRWLREAMVLLPNTPEVPDDMEGFTFTEANDIEMILVNIETIINLMLSSIIYSGKIFSGEVI